MDRLCLFCGDAIDEAKRQGTRYCSPLCRFYAWRMRQEPEPAESAA